MAGSSFTFGGFISVISIESVMSSLSSVSLSSLYPTMSSFILNTAVGGGDLEGINGINGVGDCGNTCGVVTGDGKVFFGIACVMEGIGSFVLSLTISSSKA